MVHDVLAGVSVHRAERVIQDVDIRVLVHRTRQADTLFLALLPQVICSASSQQSLAPVIDIVAITQLMATADCDETWSELRYRTVLFCCFLRF